MFRRHLGPVPLLFSLVLGGCGANLETEEDVGRARQASHSWGNYHWARMSNPFTLKLGDNLTSIWDPYLATTSADWSVSSVLDTTVVAGGSVPKNCKPKAGMVQVCNSRYGNNGWLGVAQILISGGHISQGTVKLNDTYFNTAKYNTPAWRNLVMCQEVGHIFGLGHNDENFTTTNGTCMDYSNDPVPNQHPNAHDYEQLELIYAHLDASTTASAAPPVGMANLDGPGAWGEHRASSPSGHVDVFVRDFGDFQVVSTVTWAE